MSRFEQRLAKLLLNPEFARGYREASAELWRYRVFGSRFEEVRDTMRRWLCDLNLHHWFLERDRTITGSSVIPNRSRDWRCLRNCGSRMTRCEYLEEAPDGA